MAKWYAVGGYDLKFVSILMHRWPLMVLHCVSLTLLACISIGGITYSQSLSLGPMPIISVGVNGKTGRFLIDTGSDQSVIDSSFAHQLGLTPTGNASVRKNYSVEELSIVVAERFQLGNTVLSAVKLLESDLAAISQAQSESLAGIVGDDVLTTNYGHFRRRCSWALRGNARFGAFDVVLEARLNLSVRSIRTRDNRDSVL